LKAQLLILSRYFRPVNPVLIGLVVSVFFLSHCGFRLNRNQITLPENARSIALQHIENKSFTPRLDLQLKEILTERFSRNAVKIQSVQIADLSLSFRIDAAGVTRSDYALDKTTQSYEFLFTVAGSLTVVSTNNKKDLIKNQTLTGIYSFKTASTDLTQTEISDGRLQALQNLGDQIIEKLTRNF